ncbi:hypothetical protein TNCT_417611 [Trichonephila clavata]|uniref:LAGLIDADG homing endonuclease n=1 Tax=Trichonephila clavata TaxID=2740835 RepID=A0A8X6FYZ9_TRICU|nr:hypothetical protein TNCT_417611 [Trichonephila clavata]
MTRTFAITHAFLVNFSLLEWFPIPHDTEKKGRVLLYYNEKEILWILTCYPERHYYGRMGTQIQITFLDERLQKNMLLSNRVPIQVCFFLSVKSAGIAVTDKNERLRRIPVQAKR